MSDQFPTGQNSPKADFEVSPEPSGAGQEPVKFNAQEQRDAFLGGGGSKPEEQGAVAEARAKAPETETKQGMFEASEPPLAPGMTRLYRGEFVEYPENRARSVHEGRWFFDNLKGAQNVARERTLMSNRPAHVSYVDVKNEDVQEYFGKKHDVFALPGSYLLPTEVMARKAVLAQALRRETQTEPIPPTVAATEALPKPPALPVVEATPVQKMDAPKPKAEKTIPTRALGSFLERIGQKIKNLRLPRTS